MSKATISKATVAELRARNESLEGSLRRATEILKEHKLAAKNATELSNAVVATNLTLTAENLRVNQLKDELQGKVSALEERVHYLSRGLSAPGDGGMPYSAQTPQRSAIADAVVLHTLYSQSASPARAKSLSAFPTAARASCNDDDSSPNAATPNAAVLTPAEYDPATVAMIKAVADKENKKMIAAIPESERAQIVAILLPPKRALDRLNNVQPGVAQPHNVRQFAYSWKKLIEHFVVPVNPKWAVVAHITTSFLGQWIRNAGFVAAAPKALTPTHQQFGSRLSILVLDI